MSDLATELIKLGTVYYRDHPERVVRPRKKYGLSPWEPVVVYGEEAMIAEWCSYVVLPNRYPRF